MRIRLNSIGLAAAILAACVWAPLRATPQRGQEGNAAQGDTGRRSTGTAWPKGIAASNAGRSDASASQRQTRPERVVGQPIRPIWRRKARSSTRRRACR